MKPLSFFDIESTGIDKKTDRIVEISILKTVEHRTWRVNPGIPIPEAATATHGITDDDVKDCPTFKEIAHEVHEFLIGSDIAGYNSNNFDVPLLYCEFHRAGIVWDYSQHRFIDVCNIFKIKESRTLSAAYRFYCGKELINAHSAKADVEATREILIAQLQRYDDLPQDINELSLFSNYGSEIVDLGGCFSKDGEGDYIFNFGKNKGKKLRDDISYLQWMCNQDFLPDAKQICQLIINQ